MEHTICRCCALAFHVGHSFANSGFHTLAEQLYLQGDTLLKSNAAAYGRSTEQIGGIVCVAEAVGSYLEFIEAELSTTVEPRIEKEHVWLRILIRLSNGFKKLRQLLLERRSKGKDAMEPSADPILSHQPAQVVSPPLAPLLVDKQEAVVPPQPMVDKVVNNSQQIAKESQ